VIKLLLFPSMPTTKLLITRRRHTSRFVLASAARMTSGRYQRHVPNDGKTSTGRCKNLSCSQPLPQPPSAFLGPSLGSQVKWTTAAAVAAETTGSGSGGNPAEKNGNIKTDTAAAAAAAAAGEARVPADGEETRLAKISDDPEKSSGDDKKTTAVVEADETPSSRENQPGGEAPSENGKKKPATEVSARLVIGWSVMIQALLLPGILRTPPYTAE